jgi:hypothetical protein
MNENSTVTTEAGPPPAPTGLRKFFTRYVREDAVLAAAAPDVWRWFTDFESFPRWNPFIRKAEGALSVGSTLDIRLRLGARIISFRPEVTLLEPVREVRWKTHVLMPGLFDVDRRFKLDPASPQQTRFIQEETNSGLLVPLAYLFANLEQELRAGFRDFSEALALQTAARKALAPPGEANGPGAPGRPYADAVTPNHAVQH